MIFYKANIFKTLIFSLLISVMIPTQAAAVLGLSKCEKIKKEVIGIEKQYFEDFKKILGNNEKQVILYDLDREVFVLLDNSVQYINKIQNDNHIFKIWKIGTNNPKCFTNTQLIQIKKMGNETAKSYIDYYDWDRYDFTSEKCKQLASSRSYELIRKQCNKIPVKVLNYQQEYKSIYTY